MATATIPMRGVKTLLNHTIDTNLELQKDGITPVAIGFEGTAGLGKTSIVKQVAEEKGMTFVKLNLAMVDEVGD